LDRLDTAAGRWATNGAGEVFTSG